MNSVITVSPGRLEGSVCAPPSKSVAHRAILCASLAGGVSEISNISYSEDIKATISAVRALGAVVEENGETLKITGANFNKALDGADIFCNESGSTLRFIIPLALTLGGTFSVSGAGRLFSRPLDDYFRICDEKDIFYEKGDNKVTFSGKLSGGVFTLSGNVSSQYITGLLLSLPLMNEESKIVITTPVESVGYIDLTIAMMRRFGVRVSVSEDYREYTICGGQRYVPQDITVEGDYSQGAFYLVANELGSNVFVDGLDLSSVQGDKAILSIIRKMREDTDFRTIDVSQVPDLVPILSVLAAKSSGVTRICGAARLRLKESDRLRAVKEELSKLGANIKEFEDALEIEGNACLTGGVTDSHNDHRIAMSLAIAATVASGDVTISGADSVKKSYHDFWEKFTELGGKIKGGSNIR